ncbi:MAG: hypothetical protein SPL55_04450 [Prevotella sp.]|nr:hypothetical protein [Prevotella sp.]
MKKNLLYFSVLSVLLVFGQALTSCLSDGDETISLEFASAKKMIVGRWKLSAFDKDESKQSPKKFPFANWKVVDTELTFFDDGTYTDSSDGGKKKHRWRLGPDGDNDSKPYYGDIYLDDYEFDINSLGPDLWRLGYDEDDDNKPTWLLIFDKEEDDPNAVEPDPEPETEERYLVSSIKKSHTYYYQPDKTKIIEYGFRYDNRGRILSMTCKGAYPEKLSFDYNDDNNSIILKDGRQDLIGIIAYLSDGMVVRYSHESKSWEFLYDKNNYLQSVVEINGKGEKTYYTLEWYKENLIHVAYSSGKKIYEYMNEKNNTNLDLNYFIEDYGLFEIYTNTNDMVIFEPFGLYGKKSTNLIIYHRGAKDYVEYAVSRNNLELPTTITYKNYDAHGAALTLTIEYAKKTVLK